MESSFWNSRFAGSDYAYGKEPNDFVKAQQFLPGEEVLCLAEGEGRNAVWIARQGCNVTAVDYSEMGQQKMNTLARLASVHVNAVLSDLEEFDPGASKWDAIVMVFGHFPPDLRRKILGSFSRALKPGGRIIMEVYAREQLELGTGGPKDADWLYSEAILRDEISGLVDLQITRQRREIHEGEFHNGISEVYQVTAYKAL